MLKIKLSRIGKRNQPHYRVVVAEAKSKRNGKATDIIGFYNPNISPKIIKIDLEKYNKWLKKGAQPTPSVQRLHAKLAS